MRGDVQAVRDGLSSATLVMRALNHPHVVPFLDVVESPQGPVLILGAAEGGSLADVLAARRTLTPGEMVTACAPIAEGLAEIHQHGIVHGAITPDEILFARDGRPMLAGVGLASIGARSYLHGPTVAPEVASGGSLGAPADVYSIAAMGIVALTGPVSADQLFAASAERLLATGMAPAAQAVITRAIGRNAGRRPDAATLVNALYAIADPEPVELVVPDEAPTTPPPLTFVDPAPRPDPGPYTGPMPVANQPPEPENPFGEENQPADELDDVTAYMRQVQAPASGRRARRKASVPAETGETATASSSPAQQRPAEEPSAAETTGGGGRRARDRRERRSDPGDDAPRSRGRAAPEGGAAAATARTDRPAKKPGQEKEPARSRGRRPSRGDLTKVASVLVVLLLAAGAVIIFMQLSGNDDELPEAGLGTPDSVDQADADLCGGPRPAPEEEPPEVSDWTQEVQRLYTLRAQAFEEVDAELLCQVYAPTSEGLARDVELLQQYADARVRTQNLSFEVIDAELLEQNGGTVVLEISDRLPPYQLIDEGGDVVREVEGTEQTWAAELVPVADVGSQAPTWRFS
ncbi:protein kinase [Phytoactinopolyspora alkaliphila]|uniref:Protein kinase n=1 Tax=Phytoactinopolyspora alkaliphila TaxID=1783498 RepID=A0A6N9YNZ1_9ACTN|nr:protein kinase [Phytoactinopolyspora alkaliphila]